MKLPEKTKFNLLGVFFFLLYINYLNLSYTFSVSSVSFNRDFEGAFKIFPFYFHFFNCSRLISVPIRVKYENELVGY